MEAKKRHIWRRWERTFFSALFVRSKCPEKTMPRDMWGWNIWQTMAQNGGLVKCVKGTTKQIWALMTTEDRLMAFIKALLLLDWVNDLPYRWTNKQGCLGMWVRNRREMRKKPDLILFYAEAIKSTLFWKVFRQFGELQTTWKNSIRPGMLADCVENFLRSFWQICSRNDLHALSGELFFAFKSTNQKVLLDI